MRAAFPRRLPQPDLARHWRRLANGLGALLGASLGLLATPERALGSHPSRPIRQENQEEERQGWWAPDGQGVAWLQGALPIEPVCIENLAAFVRLLPCGAACGLASLLRSPQLWVGAPYLSMRLRLALGHARLSLTAVLPGRGGDARAAGTYEWEMARSLRAHIPGPCPCTAASAVRVRLQAGVPLSRGCAGLQSVSAWPHPAVRPAGVCEPLTFDLLGPGACTPAAARCPMLPIVRWHAPAAGAAPAPGSSATAAPSVHARARVRGVMASISMQLSLPTDSGAALAGSAGNASAPARARWVLQQGLPWWLQLWMHTLWLSAPDAQACTLWFCSLRCPCLLTCHASP